MLYPIKFIPRLKERLWGGKELLATVKAGKGAKIDPSKAYGESWELSAVAGDESVVANGLLKKNNIEEIIEVYMGNLIGEKNYDRYGLTFPLLIKSLDCNDVLSVQVHPDDEIAAERYDALGKSELWYVLDAQPDANVYMGFKREVTAQEFYDKCNDGTVVDLLNVFHPKKGDVLFITPGTVHAVDGNIQLVEIQESSDLTFRLYDWGREFNPATARPLHLDEAIDIIDYRQFDQSLFIKGPLWEEECHCHEEECHCHEDKVTETLAERPEFCATQINLTDPLHIYTDQFESFIVYICVEGAASIQVPSVNEKGEACMENYEFSKGETVLVPADMPDFFLVPRDRSTILLEAVCRPDEDVDTYIDPETEAFLEGEDYEGLESEEESAPSAGASPLNFFS